MSDSEAITDLGATLRALRRAADLSQRQLAGKSGVPQATIARIEPGRSSDPGFRTVERLVAAAAGRITISALTAGERPPASQEELRDAAGRHCPAPLDAARCASPGTGRARGGRTGTTSRANAGPACPR